jgi:hypothetical protein
MIRLSKNISIEKATRLVEDKNKDIDWILLDDADGKLRMLMPIAELAKYLQSEEVLTQNHPEDDDLLTLDLFEIPANRLQLSPISLQSNLQQAHEQFEQGAEALYVVFNKAEDHSRVYGIISEESVELAYKPSTKIK